MFRFDDTMESEQSLRFLGRFRRKTEEYDFDEDYLEERNYELSDDEDEDR